MSHGKHEKLTQKPSRKQKVLAGNRLGFGGKNWFWWEPIKVLVGNIILVGKPMSCEIIALMHHTKK